MKIINLSFNYNNQTIFQNFNFESKANIINLMGPSGCGKTTLLKLISNNLIPNQNATIDSYKKIFYIVQEESLFPWLNGWDNIIKFIKVSEKDIKNHIFYSILEPILFKKTSQLSFGQKRKIELFRALVYKPDLLLLDEPFNYVDNEGRKLFSEQFENISKNGTKIIMTTHYKDDILLINKNLIQTYIFSNEFPITKLKLYEN